MDRRMVNRLVQLIESGLSVQTKARRSPKFEVVAADTLVPEQAMEPFSREAHIRIIKHHCSHYGLQILVDQACIGYSGLNGLPDDALLQLHKDIDRARECIADGISLEDAGLIRACA